MSDTDDNGAEPEPEPELDAVEAELAAALREDPVPPGVVEAARVAWTWRVVDAELAELLAEETALVRSSTADAAVAYAAGDVVIDVERVTGAGGTGVVVGLVTGVDPSAVEVEVEVVGPAGVASPSLPAELDAGGGFRVEVPAGRPARIVVTLPDGSQVVTPWLPS